MSEEVLKFKLKRDELIMLAVVFFYIMCCPYNKVEESFNTQAIHDIIYNTKYLYYYDHITFPGSVPRTFIGAISVALPTGLVSYVCSCSKAVTYMIARGVLGLYVVWSFSAFRRAVKKAFGATTGRALVAITCSQFHFLFYASRTLPNTFGMCCMLIATAYWITKQWENFLWWSGLAVLIFRSELVILLGPMLLWELLRDKLKLEEIMMPGAQTAALLLLVCCSIDTYLWRYTVWPEAVVLYYNTWLNKSSDWGTQPFLWYFYSALPRAMLSSLPLAAVGALLERKVLKFVSPALLFLFLYSLLPHKELRFVLYAVPILNVAAAHFLASLWNRGLIYRLATAGALLANIACCGVFLSASYHNYPGGPAMASLHSQFPCTTNTTVYIGNYAAQNGVSRFGEECDSLYHRQWNYVKTENLSVEKIRHYDLLLLEPAEADRYTLTHTIIETFYVYAGLEISTTPPFIRTRKREALYLMRSKKLKKSVEVRGY